MKICVLIPTYNNDRSVCDVIDRILAEGEKVIVVNDGSTDTTGTKLLRYEGDSRVEVVSYTSNRGKGYALCRGFEKAMASGFDYVVTLDADGQHLPTDVPRLKKALVQLLEQKAPKRGVMVVGCRNLKADGMPGSNTFANRFSNFWFCLQTLHRLPDTQSGFRIYDLKHLPDMRMLTDKYECELELLVYSAWRRVTLVPVPVQVYYPPEGERVSHFRFFADFARISLLNTVLCIAAVFYGLPGMLIRKLMDLRK
ncbi:MAG: glycosyltransferase family 2 protein [Bacteroidales bacterium]|nr:glycosyltransferase family 2 protein [Bacteroidales bacterium]